jgi:purine nucleosidase
MTRKTAILLDTDIGSDVDDSIALSYLLRQPLCELVGITTVSGEPEKRAAIADAVCNAAGRRDIPIHVGVEAPLIVPQNQPVAPHYEALSKWKHDDFGEQNTAIRFLSDSIRSRPGEIILLTIGPLTNIALLFAIDPEIPKLLRGVVGMAGEFFNPNDGSGKEWNVVCDPEAAAMVFAAPVDITLIGLDVTTKCQLEQAECISKFEAAGGPLSVVAETAKIWFRGAKHATFHDPLAAALIFEPTLCDCVPVKLDVDLRDTTLLGRTTVTPSPESRVKAAQTVNADAFFEHYFRIVNEEK